MIALTQLHIHTWKMPIRSSLSNALFQEHLESLQNHYYDCESFILNILSKMFVRLISSNLFQLLLDGLSRDYREFQELKIHTQVAISLLDE